ncbi:MAG: hypothetical protein PT118_25540 [Aphanizomenon gracile PMC644.10]|nr:hypothetical protein [Aphanizomenon gracile PMC638.10]MDM3863113.1 hypothetical protein [Aphanizomenon gracile PMC644.10]
MHNAFYQKRVTICIIAAIASPHPKRRFLRSASLSHSHLPNHPKRRSHLPTSQTAIALPHPKSDRIPSSQKAIALPTSQKSDRTPSSPKAIASHHPQRAIVLPHPPVNLLR